MNPPAQKSGPLFALLRRRSFLLFAVVSLASAAIILVTRVQGGRTPPPAPAAPRESFEAAVTRDPSFDNLVALSVELIRARRHREAIDACDRALRLKPGNAIALNNKATAQISLGEVAQAEENLALALKAAPEFALAKNNLKWAADVRRGLEKDLVRLRQQQGAAQTPDQRKAASFELASTQFLVGDYKGSDETYAALIRLDPNDARAYNNIGINQMFLADYAAAIRSFGEAVKLDPNTALYGNNLRWAESERGKAGR